MNLYTRTKRPAPESVMRKLILVILSIFFTAIPLRAGADTECQASESEIQNAIGEVHTKQSNVGLAAAIVRGEHILFSEYLGLADVEFGIDVDRNTRFGIASITKLYTAVALLQLRANGQLELSDTVQKHYPDFPKKPEGEITLEMLAKHTSGIPHPQSVRTPKLFATHFETATDAVSVFADDELLFTPGSDAKYSSSNYNLIAAIAEQITGQDFKDVVAAGVFDMLNLTETGFDNALRPLPFRARRYSYYRPWTYAESDELFLVPVWDYSFNTGGGNIVATAADVARFGAALSKPGLLPEKELRLLQSIEWFGDIDDNGQHYIFASGANPGVQAGLAIIPESGIAAVVLSNTWGLGSRSGEMTQLALRLARLCDSTLE
jgi:CubicO group peptidase (beta-lactamase class C family)